MYGWRNAGFFVVFLGACVQDQSKIQLFIIVELYGVL